MNVVKEDGDVAFFRLSLTCWLFHGVVCEASFRKEAHFAWLDSKLFNFYIFTSTQFFFILHYTLRLNRKCIKLCSELFNILNLFLTIGIVNWSAYSSDYKEMN